MTDPAEGDADIDRTIVQLTSIYNEAVEAEQRARAFAQHARDALIEVKLRKMGITIGKTVVYNGNNNILVERVGSPVSMTLHGRRVYPCGTLGSGENRVGDQYTVVGEYQRPTEIEQIVEKMVKERERHECLEEV